MSTIPPIFNGLSDAAKERLAPAAFPRWVDPMLATLWDKPFSRPGWIFEDKLDGVRCLAFKNGSALKIMSRNQNKLNAAYPELTEALLAVDVEQLIVDGEIVAFDGDLTSFQKLQGRLGVTDERKARMRARELPVFLYLFDLLYLDGFDTRGLALVDRKTLLRDALPFAEPIRYLQHREEYGLMYFEAACEQGLEGVMAKEASSTYASMRSKKWLKFKCVNRQEFVIGGYTDPQGSREGLGALLVGTYDRGRLIYAGKVGTGFDALTTRDLMQRLEPLERATPPFDEGELPRLGAHWVEPQLVGEVGFAEWTNAGMLRHPRFLGLRLDKDPRSVVRER